MMHVIRSASGELIARVEREVAKRLQSRSMIVPAKSRRPIWDALVSGVEIRAAIRASIRDSLPVAEDNRTSILVGRTWQHHTGHCNAYAR